MSLLCNIYLYSPLLLLPNNFKMCCTIIFKIFHFLNLILCHFFWHVYYVHCVICLMIFTKNKTKKVGTDTKTHKRHLLLLLSLTCLELNYSLIVSRLCACLVHINLQFDDLYSNTWSLERILILMKILVRYDICGGKRYMIHNHVFPWRRRHLDVL